MSEFGKTLDKATDDKVSFITFIIGEFARVYRMNRQQAYLYLKQYGGLDFIFECWWALHTDNPNQAVFDINHICQLNGGTR
ncbi:MAG: DUF3791 domain-containing protein [Bacteroidales bacterium]|nr:DUF3791 domain-containing protein [Bacteroidales bacterium]